MEQYICIAYLSEYKRVSNCFKKCSLCHWHLIFLCSAGFWGSQGQQFQRRHCYWWYPVERWFLCCILRSVHSVKETLHKCSKISPVLRGLTVELEVTALIPGAGPTHRVLKISEKWRYSLHTACKWLDLCCWPEPL